MLQKLLKKKLVLKIGNKEINFSSSNDKTFKRRDEVRGLHRELTAQGEEYLKIRSGRIVQHFQEAPVPRGQT